MTEENKPEPTASSPAGCYIFPVTVDVNEGKAVATLNKQTGFTEGRDQPILSAGTYLIRASYEGVVGSAETTFFLTLTGSFSSWLLSD